MNDASDFLIFKHSPCSVSSFQKDSMQSEKTLLIPSCWLILGLRISDVYLSPRYADKYSSMIMMNLLKAISTFFCFLKASGRRTAETSAHIPYISTGRFF